jgi:hypothetical protein
VTEAERKNAPAAGRHEPEEPGRDRDALGSWRSIDDRTLVRAMREARPEAVDEFIRRFEGIVLHYARWLRVPPHEQGRWAADVLYEVALTIAGRHGPPPGHLAGYVIAVCKLKGRQAPALSSSARCG